MKDKEHLRKFDRTGTKHTEESKEKMRQAKLGESAEATKAKKKARGRQGQCLRRSKTHSFEFTIEISKVG